MIPIYVVVTLFWAYIDDYYFLQILVELMQCESMGAVEKKLDEMEIKYATNIVHEGGIKVDQLFFHDPDGFMIEICNCDSLPVVPLAGEMAQSCSRVKLHQMVQPQPQTQIHQVVHP